MSHYDTFNDVFEISGLPENERKQAEYLFWQGVYAQYASQKNQPKLSAYQADILSKELAYTLTEIQQNRQQMSAVANVHWVNATPNTADGELHFNALNEVRDFQRKLKSYQLKLESAQKVLKIIAKG